MATQLKLPDNPTPEQFEKLKKPLVKSIIESIYTDGVDDLTVQMPGDDGALATGKFLDKRIGQANRVFTYKLSEDDGEFILDYQPLTGDFAEADEGYRDDEVLFIQQFRSGNLTYPADMEFNEGEPIDENWIANYEQGVQDRLFESIRESGLGYLLEFVEEEPEWARGH